MIMGFRHIFRQIRAAIMFLALCCVFASSASAGKITNLRIGQGIGSVRIVFDADSKFDYKVFTLL